MTKQIEALRQWVAESESIVFFGGAGVSTESGIPDFRSVDGLYHQKFQYPPETILSHSFYVRRKAEFYDFYRAKMLAPWAEPNAAHRKLAQWEQEGRLKAVITQNIDNDFYRTQRQRNVLQAIYTKFRQSNAADLMKLLDEVLPYLSTDMTNSQIMLLAAKCIPIMGSAELSSYRVPADDAYHYASIRGMSVVVPDLDKIHEDLLNEYLPLNAEKESSE